MKETSPPFLVARQHSCPEGDECSAIADTVFVEMPGSVAGAADASIAQPSRHDSPPSQSTSVRAAALRTSPLFISNSECIVEDHHLRRQSAREIHSADFSPTALKPVLLITSRSRATVIFLSSYLINASPFSKLTRASSTPSVFFNACSTERAQPPQVMPVTRMVMVRVAAEAVPAHRANASTKVMAMLILLLPIFFFSLTVSFMTLELNRAAIMRLRDERLNVRLVLFRKTLDCFVDFSETARAGRVSDFTGTHSLFDKSADTCGNRAATCVRDLLSRVAFSEAEAVAERARIAARLYADKLAQVRGGKASTALTIINHCANWIGAEAINFINHSSQYFIPYMVKHCLARNSSPETSALRTLCGCFCQSPHCRRI